VRLLLVAILSWLIAGAVAAWYLTMPRPRPIAARAPVAGRPVEDLEVQAKDGVRTRGWLVRAGAASSRAVVLAAGVRGYRLAMLTRAEWYLEHGWSTLLVDLRGTGASDPARISMGWHEAKDLLAWRRRAHDLGFASVGAHGQSLGAAAIVYGVATAANDNAWDFIVLESCYGDIDSALGNRLPWVPLRSLVLWPMLWCCEWLAGVERERLRPLAVIDKAAMPTLLLCGDADPKVGRAETDGLFAACGASVKQLVWIHGAGHVDLMAADPRAFTAALQAFLARR